MFESVSLELSKVEIGTLLSLDSFVWVKDSCMLLLANEALMILAAARLLVRGID